MICLFWILSKKTSVSVFFRTPDTKTSVTVFFGHKKIFGSICLVFLLLQTDALSEDYVDSHHGEEDQRMSKAVETIGHVSCCL